MSASPSRYALVEVLVPAFRQALLAGLLFAFLPAQAAEDPRRWLERMNDALVDRNYRGEFSYYDGSELSSLRIFHAVIDGEQRERLVHLDGSRREIVRHGDEVSCVLDPDDRMLEFAESIPAGPFARSFSHGLAAVPEGYDVELASRGRIAGRAAHRVDLVPDDDTPATATGSGSTTRAACCCARSCCLPRASGWRSSSSSTSRWMSRCPRPS